MAPYCSTTQRASRPEDRPPAPFQGLDTATSLYDLSTDPAYWVSWVLGDQGSNHIFFKVFKRWVHLWCASIHQGGSGTW